jgi:hypothetical protein
MKQISLSLFKSGSVQICLFLLFKNVGASLTYSEIAVLVHQQDSVAVFYVLGVLMIDNDRFSL